MVISYAYQRFKKAPPGTGSPSEASPCSDCAAHWSEELNCSVSNMWKSLLKPDEPRRMQRGTKKHSHAMIFNQYVN